MLAKMNREQGAITRLLIEFTASLETVVPARCCHYDETHPLNFLRSLPPHDTTTHASADGI
jgi:hypothetical protein